MTPDLALLRDSGYLSAIDEHFAKTVCQISKESDPLVLLGAAVASRYTMHGHVCVPISVLAGKALDLGKDKLEQIHWPAFGKWISALEKSPLVHCKPAQHPLAPLVLEADRLYLARYWLYEKSLAQKIQARASARAEDLDQSILHEGLARLFSEDQASPDSWQKKAAQMALERKLAIITGGPGTGKTSTVAKILVLLFEQSAGLGKATPRVSLLAPTGKAAQGMEESLRLALDDTGPMRLQCEQEIKDLIREIPGSTIHRALGYKPKTPTRFKHNSANPLDSDMVIVDEASMVDLPLMAKLFDAVDDGARLVMLGDKDQLVSVELGAVLGDIYRPVDSTRKQQDLFSGIASCIINLTHSYRFSADAGIGLLARAVNMGRSDEALEYLEDEKYTDLLLVEPTDKASMAQILGPIITEPYRRYLKRKNPQKRMEALDKFRILCAHRRGPTGAENINPLTERLLGLHPNAGPEIGWYDGQPIMISHNDYQLGLFNGDVGVMCRDEQHHNSLRAFFPGKSSSFLPSRLPAHETVFAMTIHKSQGSEYDQVLILMPQQISPIVTRELLYTAITRAKKAVTIIASKDIISHAIETPVLRSSGLGESLWNFH